MFDESQNKKEPEDIFSGTDPQPSQGMPPQNLPPADPAAPQGGQAMDAVPTMPPSGDGSNKKLVVVAIVVVVIVITLIAVLVGLWVVRRGQAPETAPAPSVQDVIEAADTSGDGEAEEDAEAMELDEDLEDLADDSVSPVIPAQPVDTDADGLTDEEELLLGTSVTLPDTDNDGLNDSEEVRVWNTNPLVADTDGDGFSDGDEVNNGYDPTQVGGVLLDINQPGLGAN